LRLPSRLIRTCPQPRSYSATGGAQARAELPKKWKVFYTVADDDLTLGSIDPYQIFRIFHEIFSYAFDSGRMPQIEYMIDQSHNLKPKIEAMIQTVMTAQELYAKASLIDQGDLHGWQVRGQIIDAERTLKRAFDTDVRPIVADWRKSHGLPEAPLDAFRQSGYQEIAAADRKKRRETTGIQQSSSYA
jgi:L-rhamnose isomerase/sugar isomerase